jgi:outer membrane protein assembly factor BamB
VAPGDGTLVALDAASGSPRWVADGATLGAPPTVRPAIGAGLVIVGVADGSAVALDAATGTAAWRYPVESGSVASVTVTGSAVLVSGSTTLAAVDPATGAAAWTVPIQASTPVFANASIPAVVGDTIVVGTTDAMDVIRVLALDIATGAERWRFETESYGAAYSPLVAGGRVYVPLLDLTGTSGLLALGDPA